MDDADVRKVLSSIDDPEMPISIVDLGIVHRVRLDDGGADRAAGPGAGPRISVEITPTFVGCPALDMIRDQIERRLIAAGAGQVDVRFVHDPPWSVDRISAAGRESLRLHGVSVPARGGASKGDALRFVPLTRSEPATYESATTEVACPHCGASPATLESAFGPTRCRMIYYCGACKNSFEHLRRV